MNATTDSQERYSRQALFAGIGRAGQERIQRSSAVILGCGALGSMIANHLARAGVGRLRLVDRDFVELGNLQRQALLDEEDARKRLPKAVAVAEKLKKINSSIQLEALVADLNPKNALSLVEGFPLVLDACDNIETRLLLNDACIKLGTPWVYGGAVASSGMVMPVIPGRTACFRCLVDKLPPAGALPTCDRAGILNALTATVASLQSAVALRWLAGEQEAPWELLFVDVWEGEFQRLEAPRRPDCPACVQRRFDFLERRAVSWTTVLCGRDMVQIAPPEEKTLPLEALARSLASSGEVSYNGFLLSLKLDRHELVLFPTGRAMVKGTSDESLARSLYAKYVGM